MELSRLAEVVEWILLTKVKKYLHQVISENPKNNENYLNNRINKLQQLQRSNMSAVSIHNKKFKESNDQMINLNVKPVY